MSPVDTAQWLLMWAVLPLWIAAGLADWWCHRLTRIERTSGLPENVFHWMLLAQAGIAVLAVALLEINAAVLLLVFAAFVLHELTTWIELRYTVRYREVRPIEQMIHSYMEMLPLLMLALLAVMHREQALAWFWTDPDFRLRPKEQPWPPAYLLGALLAAGVFNVLPMAEESLRCARAAQTE
jgi:hypothetical protein